MLLSRHVTCSIYLAMLCLLLNPVYLRSYILYQSCCTIKILHYRARTRPIVFRLLCKATLSEDASVADDVSCFDEEVHRPSYPARRNKFCSKERNRS